MVSGCSDVQLNLWIIRPGDNVTTFRTSTSEDLPFLREMLYLAIHVDPDEPPPPPEIIASPVLSQYIEGFGEQRGDIGIVALDDGQRVGAAWVRLIKGYGFVGDNIPELSIAILPDYRGLSIGSELLAQLFPLVKPNFEQISLSVSERNPAKHLYERVGFETVSVENGSAIMIKSL